MNMKTQLDQREQVIVEQRQPICLECHGPLDI